MPAFEDTAHWLQKEAGLPVNVDPTDPKLADPEERARMARVFDQGLNKPKVLCCRSSAGMRGQQASRRWRSEHWKIRRGHLFLLPGNSPLGLAAADRLAASTFLPEEYPYIVEQDPMEPRDELPA